MESDLTDTIVDKVQVSVKSSKKKPTYEERRAAGELSFEEICDHSRSKVGDIDTRRWDVGDDACAMETKYGEATLASMAREIGMNKTTLAAWKRVADYYPNDNNLRGRLLDELANLSYSHYKDAIRLGDVSASIAWLEKCSVEGWSPDQASHELTLKLQPDEDDGDDGDDKDDEPKGIPGKIENVYEVNGSMAVVEISIGLDDLEAIKHLRGMQVTIKT